MAIGLVPEAPKPDQAQQKNILARIKDRVLRRKPQPEEPKVALTIERSDKFTGQRTGHELNARGKIEKTYSEKANKIELSEELRDTYSDYLKTYVAGLLRVSQQDRAILESTTHAVDLSLLNQLTTSGVPDEAKIKTFLESPDNWDLATMVIERTTFHSLVALGLNGLKIDAGARQDTPPDQLLIRIGLDQSRLNRLYQDNIARRFIPPHRARTLRAINVGGLIGTAGAMIGSAINRGYGALTGAGVGVLAAYGGNKFIQSLTTDGVRFNMEQSVDALQYIQTNPRETDFMRIMTGINARDFQITATNTIAYIGDTSTSRIAIGAAADMRNEDAIRQVSIAQDQVLKGLIARLEYYTECGVPHQLLDALPEQFLLTGGPKEQTGALWEEDVWRAFQATGGVGANVVDNIERYEQARLAVMMDYLRRSVDAVQLNEKPGEGIIDSITTKKNNRIGEGKTIARRKSEVNDRIAAFGKDKEKVTNEKTTFESYEQKLRELQEQEREFKTEFPDPQDTDIDTAMNRRKNINIDSRTFLKPHERRLWEKQIRDLRARLRATPINTNQDILIMIQAREKDFLEAGEKAKQDQLTLLTTLQTSLREKRAQIDTTSQTLRDISSLDRSITEDFNLITSWGITPAELQTLTTDQLLERINQINTANPHQGWSSAENQRELQRQRLLHAVVEARVAVIASYDPFRANREAVVNLLTGAGLTTDQLRTLSVNEIHTLMNQRFAAPGGGGLGYPPNQNDINTFFIEAAIQEVTRDRLADRARGRIRISTDLTRTLDQNVIDEQNRLKNIDLGSETDVLEMTLALAERQDKILSGTDDLINGGQRDRFTDITRVNSADTRLLPAERAAFAGAQLPRAYLEIMNLMFDYRARADNNEYFQKILRVLPPDKLIGILHDSDNMGLQAVPVTIDGFFAEVQGRIRDGRIDRVTLALGFKDVINHLVQEANALP